HTNRADVAIEHLLIVIAAASIVGKMRQRKLREDRGGATVVITMVVTDDLIVDLSDAKRLEVVEGLCARSPHAVVEENRFAVRGDEDGAVALPNVHEMNLELIGLRPRQRGQADED